MAEYFIPSIPLEPEDVTAIAAIYGPPLLLGPLFNWTLYGILCVQIYIYSYNFPDDTRLVKFIAYFIFLLETVQTALTGSDLYYWFVEGFGQTQFLSDPHFMPVDIHIMTAVSSLIVQGYFCYRIWVLNKGLGSSWFCWIIATSAVTQAVAAMWIGATTLVDGNFGVVQNEIAMCLWTIPSALADIMIAVAMTRLIRKAGSKYSKFILVRVVRLTVETNTLTAITAVATLVLNVVFNGYTYYYFSAMIIGKLYTNTLLVSLNNRIYFRDHGPSVQDSGFNNSTNPQVSVWVCATSVTPPPSAVTPPEPEQWTPNDDILPIYAIPQPNSSKENDTEARWTLPYPQKYHLLPQDPEWTVGTSSRHSR